MLNGTLFIQILNFVFVYILVDRILLKKAVKLIYQEQDEQANLMTDIAQKRNEVLAQENEMQEHWYNHQRIFSEHIPMLKKIVPSAPSALSIHKPIMSRQEREQKIEKLAQYMVNKVIPYAK